MAKQAQRRIPGTVVPILEPAEASVETGQQPNRFAERTGQMRDCRIDADYEIKALDESRRVGKITYILGEVVKLHAARRASRLGRRRTFLQRDKLHARYFAKQR